MRLCRCSSCVDDESRFNRANALDPTKAVRPTSDTRDSPKFALRRRRWNQCFRGNSVLIKGSVKPGPGPWQVRFRNIPNEAHETKNLETKPISNTVRHTSCRKATSSSLGPDTVFASCQPNRNPGARRLSLFPPSPLIG